MDYGLYPLQQDVFFSLTTIFTPLAAGLLGPINLCCMGAGNTSTPYYTVKPFTLAIHIENFYDILWFTYMLENINFSNSYFYNKSKRADLKADFKMDYIIQLYMQYSTKCGNDST